MNSEWSKETLAKNLKHYMEKTGKTQKELAKVAGVSEPTFSYWINAIKYPRIDKIQALADYFGILKSDLIEEKPKAEQRKLPPNIITPAAHPIPVLGTICAGDGTVAEENFSGQFFVDSSIHADYALRVTGDSMIEAEIYNGDMAFLRKEFDFRAGWIYAVVHGIDREASLKKVYRQEDKLILQPCNSDYAPIVADQQDCYIVGELVGVYHAYSDMIDMIK